jgi:hypothetical protein
MKATIALFLLLAGLLAAPSSQAQTPPPPTLLTAVGSFYYVPDIYVSWRGPDNSVGGVTYRIYRSLGDSAHFELVGTSYYSVYADFQILGAQVYYYYVTSNVLLDTVRYESERSSYVSAIAVQQGGGGGGGGGSKRKNNGTIAGRVTDNLSGKPIYAAQVAFYRVSSAGVPVQKLLTDGSGHYKAALDTGTYVIKAQPPLSSGSLDYSPEWYDHASDPSHAVRIHVDDSSRIVVDFALTNPDTSGTVTVSGTVRDSAGASLKGARVAILRSIQDMEEHSSSSDDLPGIGKESTDIEDLGHAQGVVWQGIVDSSGRFEGMVAPGQSYVVLAVKQGYVPQYFLHQSNPAMASLLSLTGDTSGVDFNLKASSPTAAYHVSGTVRDSNDVHVPSRIVLLPVRHQSDDSPALFAYTDSIGVFTVPHVQAGQYIALALPFSLYAPAYHRTGAFGASRWQEADTIIVGADVMGIDVGVKRITVGGINRVSGRIASGVGPVRGADVYAAYANGTLAGYTITDDNGFYSIGGLPSEQISLSTDLQGFQSVQKVITIAPGDFSVNGVDLTLSPAVVSSVESSDGIAHQFALQQNYPNPFNPLTIIKYTVGGAGGSGLGTRDVSLIVYDVLGREVRVLVNEKKAAGSYVARFDGNGLATGVYVYRLTAGPLVQSKKMLLLK